ncbi:Outer membrane protein beta-barrel domain-containing protein [Daejeonella rubra]|uniref:Outer membrane protein beta-barrel domain-containing protein n=1 Tax=Daejeonella rubra TaxID=990371 RepID=A0A1G9PXU7_9SPHI|nr:porin family protein [Daejeonella rubra]SDM03642.1 Outer membrane protein beta-barrel domain-containing protein [Daejeonella rubra]
MKKIIMFTCLLGITGLTAMAQIPKFTFGIKGGVNYSNLKTKDDLTDENSIMGYQAGVFTRVGAAGLYFQPELYLGTKGNEYTSIETSSGMMDVKGKIKFTTLDLPLLVGTKIGTNKLNLRFMAGPIVSFVIDEDNNLGTAYNSVTDFGNYKKQTFGFQAGSGVDLGNLTFDVRYEAGLSNVSQSEKYSQQQNLFHLSLGFKLL